MKSKLLALFSVLIFMTSFSVTARVCIKNSTTGMWMRCAYDATGEKPTSSAIPAGQSCKYAHSKNKTVAGFFSYKIKGNFTKWTYRDNPKDGDLIVCTGGYKPIEKVIKVTCKVADRKCK